MSHEPVVSRESWTSCVPFRGARARRRYVNGDTTPHYHRSTDTYDTMNFEYLRTVTAVTAEAFKELVGAPA